MSQVLVRRDEYTPTGWDIISTYLTVQIYSNFARTTVKMNIEASNSNSLPPLFLYGQNLDLKNVGINNVTQQISDIYFHFLVTTCVFSIFFEVYASSTTLFFFKIAFLL